MLPCYAIVYSTGIALGVHYFLDKNNLYFCSQRTVNIITEIE